MICTHWHFYILSCNHETNIGHNLLYIRCWKNIIHLTNHYIHIFMQHEESLLWKCFRSNLNQHEMVMCRHLETTCRKLSSQNIQVTLYICTHYLHIANTNYASIYYILTKFIMAVVIPFPSNSFFRPEFSWIVHIVRYFNSIPSIKFNRLVNFKEMCVVLYR